MQEHRNSLQPGYRLHWYVIKRILGQGGFGITYLAEDTNLQQEVAIKEYLPVELAVRDQDASIHPLSGEYGKQYNWGLDRFMSEAQTLAQFKHPNIVRVLAVFPENNSAYMVMEFEKGEAMHELLKRRKTLDEPEINTIFLPLLDGLEQVHRAGFIHRDIKPPNIFIRADGSPVLLDFGSARQALGQQTRTLTSMVSPGFAPFEQYLGKGDKQGPWTDIYGLGATLYRSAIGRSPAEAMDRSEALLHTARDAYVPASEIKPAGYSQAFLRALDHALAFKPEQRPQSVAEWRAEFSATPAASGFTEAATIKIGAGPGSIDAGEQAQATFAASSAGEAATEVEATRIEKPRRWYRRPLKVVAVIFAVLVLLSILDDGKRKDRRNQEAAGAETSANDESGEAISPDDIDGLLAAAKKDILALRLSSPKDRNALAKYQQVLALEPGNDEAASGIQNIAGKYLELAQRSLQKHDTLRAAQYVDRATDLYAAHPEIPRVRDAIARQRAAAGTDVPVSDQSQDSPGDAGTGEDRVLVSWADRLKLKRIQKQLGRNPDSSRARQELRSLATKYEAAITQALEAGDYGLAEGYVEALLEISPDNKKLLESLAAIRARKASE